MYEKFQFPIFIKLISTGEHLTYNYNSHKRYGANMLSNRLTRDCVQN
jgi:hypothetical protein